MKIKNIISIIASAALLASLAGCQATGTTSVPTISINNDNTSNDNPAGEPANDQPAESGEESGDPNAESWVEITSKPENDPGVIADDGDLIGAVFVCSDGRGIPLFGGGSGNSYVSAINKVKSKVGSQVNVFSMIVPTAGSFYLPEDYSYAMADEWDCIQSINSRFVGIIPVDAYSALARHTNEEIFARTDHHWNQLGAYYAAETFVNTAQISVPFTPISDYERRDIEGYLGTLYASSEYDKNMGDHPETFTYYIPPNDFTTYYMNPEDTDFYTAPMFLKMDVSSSYSTFMGGDEKVVHVETDVKNGRKLLIVKDSYPNALVPCLTGSFQDIWTVDMRHLRKMEHFPHSISEIVREQGITDVLFCMNTFSAVGEIAENLPYIT